MLYSELLPNHLYKLVDYGNHSFYIFVISFKEDKTREAKIMTFLTKEGIRTATILPTSHLAKECELVA